MFTNIVYDENGNAITSFFTVEDAYDFKWNMFNHWGTVVISDEISSKWLQSMCQG